MEPMVLTAEAATPANIAPFGFWLGREAPGPVRRSGFYGQTIELRNPAQFVCDETLDITVATVHRRPLQVSWLERHALHTQSFLPLGGKPFVLVLAPPCAGDMPDLQQAKALLFDGTAGIALRIGTWHEFPLALVDDTTVVVLVRKDTMRDLARIEGNEAFGPDLDKKDILARTGRSIRVMLA
jgi:ureidoglycolate lyase